MENKSMKIDIQPSLNRGILFTAFPNNIPVNFVLSFNKQTTAMQFQLDYGIKNKEITVNMYRNLENCPFVKKFLNTKTEKTEFLDYRSEFISLKDEYSDFIIPFFNEKYNLNSLKDDNKNIIIIKGFKVHGLDDDFVFYLFQRRCLNLVTKIDTLRTAALQFSNDKMMESVKTTLS